MKDGRIEPLLVAGSATDVCLTCHASEAPIVLGANALLPPPEKGGGDFVFLREDNINDAADGATNPIGGHRAGHSIVSLAYGLVADLENATAPGGTYPSQDLGCTSCHDPHGSDQFRMLWTAGDTDATGFTFAYAAPQGDELNAISGVESASLHSAYQADGAFWCANCHGVFHDTGPGFHHPVNEILDSGQTDSYNGYLGETNPYGGVPETAYLPETPFEDPAATSTSTAGPAASSSRVTCMSCHRAHATSAVNALRWDPTVVFLDEDGIVSGSHPIPNPYPGASQRSLCIKCHVDDTRDHGLDESCMSCHSRGGGRQRQQMNPDNLRTLPVPGP